LPERRLLDLPVRVQRALPELLLPEVLVPLLRAFRRSVSRREKSVLAEARRAYLWRQNLTAREELASPSSAWLHLPATVELAACFPRPS
jgi:hypothetical protein